MNYFLLVVFMALALVASWTLSPRLKTSLKTNEILLFAFGVVPACTLAALIAFHSDAILLGQACAVLASVACGFLQKNNVLQW